MTCLAITISEMCQAHVGTNSHVEGAVVKVGRTFLSARLAYPSEEAELAAMSPRKFVYCAIASGQSNRREILRCAQNDMLCNDHRRNVSVIRWRELSC